MKHNRFYTPFQVALATFLGTILAGLLCISINYNQLDMLKNLKLTLFVASLLVPLFISIYIAIPASGYDRLWPIGTALLMWLVAYALQGKIITRQLDAGDARKSVWNVLGMVLFSLGCLLVVLVVLMKFFDLDLPVQV